MIVWRLAGAVFLTTTKAFIEGRDGQV